jgi:hypothetical protein
MQRKSRVRSGLAQEEGRCRLINFGVVGCTLIRAFDTFPLKSQWRIHLDPLRHIRACVRN